MIFISEKRLVALIDAAVKKQNQNMLWGWGESETPGLYREFDSLHSKIRALQLQVNAMQSRIDDFKALIAALDAKVDEWKNKPAGVPVDVFDDLAAKLREVLAKFG